MNLNVISAIFRRNFFSYFSNPTGYVFICVYVLLNSFAAFWPNEFFNSNLANLDQLNRYLPYIMLVFIPAITMSVWAEERRQGTDELLLTIPAGDFDVVLGKYLAAVAIYSVALIFSLVCNLFVLSQLGSPDLGLFVGTYLGYWMVGLAMLAIGMVASFLTGNLTVGFVLGALFNAPLAFAAKADAIFPPEMALKVKGFSLEEQFRDFGRGVISLSSAAYFLMIVAVMLYLSMVLIGRRHWLGGRDGRSLAGHYAIRAVALLVVAASAIVIFDRYDLRADVTSERLTSLSPQTRTLIDELDPKRPVRIDAYLSSEVPESYVQTRLDLESTLREFASRGAGKISVHIHATRPLSEEADLAEKQFGITGRQVTSRSRGAISREEIFLGVAVASGLDKVVIPFVDRGIPVEYELIRSVATVAQRKRKRIGVLVTDAKMFGGFNPQTMTPTNNELLITELEKQYDVTQVNADAPITAEMDVMLAVQPSSLSPEQMTNFLTFLKGGTPAAIFEDPFPAMAQNVTPTSAPKRPPQQANPFMMGNQPPMPKGDIRQLWDLLGVDFEGGNIVWQKYMPVPKLQAAADPEWVFVDSGASDKSVFNEGDDISSGLQQLLFLFPGAITGKNTSKLKFSSLVETGNETGTVTFGELLTQSPFGGGGGLNPNRRRRDTRQYYTLAAHITGQIKTENLPMSDDEAEPGEDEAASGEGDTAASEGDAEHKHDADDGHDHSADDGHDHAAAEAAADADDKSTDGAKKDAGAKKDDEEEEKAKRTPGEINVVLVSDIDLLYSDFFMLRSMGDDPDRDFSLNLDNVTFVLNALDMLAGDERFVEVRKRRRVHRILEKIEIATKESREEAQAQLASFESKFEEAKETEQKKFDDEIAKIEKQKNQDPLKMLQQVQMAREAGQRRLQAKVDQLQKQKERDVNRIERDLALKVSRAQDRYKLWAVLLPPIPPLLVGLGVYFSRRAREREGVSRNRLR